jgi:hypothetical protein
MSEKTNNPNQGQALQAISKKVFSAGPNEAPYPIFVNDIEFNITAVDVFMDVGLVSPESVQTALKAANQMETAEVNFNVNSRFVMSLQTAVQMHSKLSQMLDAAKVQLATAGASSPEKEG